MCGVAFWDDCGGVVAVNDDGGFLSGVYGFADFRAHFFFVDYGGVSLFVFA